MFVWLVLVLFVCLLFCLFVVVGVGGVCVCVCACVRACVRACLPSYVYNKTIDDWINEKRRNAYYKTTAQRNDFHYLPNVPPFLRRSCLPTPYDLSRKYNGNHVAAAACWPVVLFTLDCLLSKSTRRTKILALSAVLCG